MLMIFMYCGNSGLQEEISTLPNSMLWAGGLRVCAKPHTYFITLVSQVGWRLWCHRNLQSEPVRVLRLCCALLCSGAIQVLRGPECQSTCIPIKRMFGDRRPCGWWTARSWMEGWASQVLMYATYLFSYICHGRISYTSMTESRIPDVCALIYFA